VKNIKWYIYVYAYPGMKKASDRLKRRKKIKDENYDESTFDGSACCFH